MDGIKKLKNEPTRALQEIVARCRPYFDRGASEALSATERQQYYAVLFILAERGHLVTAECAPPVRDRPRDLRQRAPQTGAPRVPHGRARKAA